MGRPPRSGIIRRGDGTLPLRARVLEAITPFRVVFEGIAVIGEFLQGGRFDGVAFVVIEAGQGLLVPIIGQLACVICGEEGGHGFIGLPY